MIHRKLNLCFQLKPTRQKSPNLSKFLNWLPIVLWVVVICYLSFSSLEELPIPSFFSADKLAHFGLYFVLEFLFLLPLKTNWLGFKIATFCAIVFSIATELIQHFFILNRYGEIADFLANLLGILVAFFYLRRRINI